MQVAPPEGNFTGVWAGIEDEGLTPGNGPGGETADIREMLRK